MNPWRLAAPVIALVMAMPLCVVFGSVFVPTGETWTHLATYVLPAVTRNTVWLVLVVAVGTLLVGTLSAWLTAVVEFPGRGFFVWAMMLPLAVPGYVFAFALAGVFGYSGPASDLWRTVTGQPLPQWGGGAASASCLILGLYPYVYLLARQAFLTQGRQSLEVAQSLGLTRLAGFWRVALPLARPWLAAGVALVIMETLADFGTVKVFNFDTFTTAIYAAWFGLFSLPAALQLSAVLLLAVAAAVVLERFWRGASRFSAQNGSAPQRRLQPSVSQRWLAFGFCALVFALAFVIPVGQLLLWALAHAEVEWMPRYWGYARSSLILASAAALLVTSLALLLGFADRHAPARTTRISVIVATLGYALPGTVLAVGFFAVIAGLGHALSAAVEWLSPGAAGVTLTGTLLVMLLAYAARFLAVAYSPITSGFERITPTLDEAARGLGASGWRILRRVHWPLLSGGTATAALLVFVDVMKELPITLITRPFGWDTLATRIFQLTTEGEWERAALPALAVVIAGLAPVLWLQRQDTTG
ncbi:MAG: iron ABC transporter permease [Pseudomonadota bacterium]